MSSSRPTRLGRGAYQRPSTDVLDDLTDPGTSGISGHSGTKVPSVTPGNSDTSDTFDPLTVMASIRSPRDSGLSGTPGVRSAAMPRDHVKVARPLVQEMRDAVWFLSEHGRPRVQLGELLDEAISAWLRAAKAEHTGGDAFPVRGRLR